MKNPSENTPLSPLRVGDVALRLRVEWRLTACGDGTHEIRPFVVGTRAVWIVAVSPSGNYVTWTEGKKNRSGGEYRHTCDRRELLSLDAVAKELSPTNAPLPELAASEVNPAAAA